MLISCPLQQGDDGSDGKDGKTIIQEKELTIVLIYDGEVPTEEQIIDLSQYISEGQEIYLIVYNLDEKKLCCCPFVFNFQVDNFDKESFKIKDSQQFNRIVTRESKIVWSGFGYKIKIELRCYE
jgi:hypothetical protein